MNIVLMDGSPRSKDSTSNYLLDVLAEKLSGHSIKRLHAREYDITEITKAFMEADKCILAFPLYVDSIPSHLLHCLEQLQSALEGSSCNTEPYVLVNCGFYDARQNHIALKMMQLWCRRIGLRWGQGIGVGAGGMSQTAPLGYATCKNLGKTLDLLVQNLLAGGSYGTLFTEPNFPRFLYKTMAHMGWRSQAKKNGIKPKELRRKCQD